MDPNNRNPGYLLGRLMAIMEKLQVEALQKEREDDDVLYSGSDEKHEKQVVNINSTIVDRFFSGASATPKAVFPRLLANSKHHEKKLMEKDTSAALRYMRYIDEIISHFGVDLKNNQLHKLPEGFPRFLNSNDQGLFVIGYHHMRHWLWMKREEKKTWALEYSEKYPHTAIPRAYIYRGKDDSSDGNSED
jgi:CRISPR-associated protein Csd1